MIARIWHGMVPREKAEEYVDYVRRTGLTDYQQTTGNMGAYILHRHEDDKAHILTISFWDSIESIKRFAGEDYEKARYYPEDAEYLLEFEEKVVHYEATNLPPSTNG